MTEAEPPKAKFRRGDGGMYVVMLGDERIGFVERLVTGKWKAVDTFMEWTRQYKTRDRAGEALRLRHLTSL